MKRFDDDNIKLNKHYNNNENQKEIDENDNKTEKSEDSFNDKANNQQIMNSTIKSCTIEKPSKNATVLHLLNTMNYVGNNNYTEINFLRNLLQQQPRIFFDPQTKTTNKTDDSTTELSTCIENDGEGDREISVGDRNNNTNDTIGDMRLLNLLEHLQQIGNTITTKFPKTEEEEEEAHEEKVSHEHETNNLTIRIDTIIEQQQDALKMAKEYLNKFIYLSEQLLINYKQPMQQQQQLRNDTIENRALENLKLQRSVISDIENKMNCLKQQNETFEYYFFRILHKTNKNSNQLQQERQYMLNTNKQFQDVVLAAFAAAGELIPLGQIKIREACIEPIPATIITTATANHENFLEFDQMKNIKNIEKNLISYVKQQQQQYQQNQQQPPSNVTTKTCLLNITDQNALQSNCFWHQNLHQHHNSNETKFIENDESQSINLNPTLLTAAEIILEYTAKQILNTDDKKMTTKILNKEKCQNESTKTMEVATTSSISTKQPITVPFYSHLQTHSFTTVPATTTTTTTTTASSKSFKNNDEYINDSITSRTSDDNIANKMAAAAALHEHTINHMIQARISALTACAAASAIGSMSQKNAVGTNNPSSAIDSSETLEPYDLSMSSKFKDM